jgi:hypothetical protein
MANVKVSAEQLIDAIKGTAGIKTTIAKRLSVHRHSIDNYLDKYLRLTRLIWTKLRRLQTWPKA